MKRNYMYNEMSELPLARPYIPIQIYKTRYDVSEGFKKGTIFPELYKPYSKKDRGN